MHPLFLQGMQGLGDTLFERWVLHELLKVRRDVYLETSWPQIFADLPVRCVRPTTRLRTQNKNIDRSANWYSLPGLIDARRWHYAARGGTIVQALLDDLGLKAETITTDGPPVGKSPVEGRYVVIRPPTVRTEWQAAARNPHPGYVGQAASVLRKRGYKIVSVADVSPPAEVLVDPPFEADVTYHRGELVIEQLLALVAGAAGVVSGVGFAVPMSLAYQVPMLLVFGGWLAANGPARIFDPRLDTSRIDQVLPDIPCNCTSATHACSKTVSSFSDRVEAFAARLTPTNQYA